MHAKTRNGGWRFLAVTVFCLAGFLADGVQAQTVWTKVNNAVAANSNTTSTDGRIPRGTSGGDNTHTLCPAVVKVGDEYKMWYSGHDGTSWRIFHATSTNGLDWEKVNNAAEPASNTGGADGRIPLGLSGSGDATIAFRPSVLHDGEMYWMWYQGRAADNFDRIYCATSHNGLAWTKVNNAIPTASNTGGTDGRLPLGGSGRGDASNIGRATVIKDGDTFKMWYTGSASGTWRGYHATSSNGLDWVKVNNVAEAANNTTGTDGRIPLGGSGRGDVSHAYILGVIKDDAVYRMWYTGNDGTWNSIYYATSPDGLTWTKANNVKLAAGNTGPWTDGRIPRGSSGGDAGYLLSGSVMREGPTFKIWYTGYDGSSVARTYMATAPADHPTIANVSADALAFSADLVADLVATGRAPATVRVYYGTNDAQFAASQWQTNALVGLRAAGVWTQQVENLDALTTYYYRFHATNDFGEDWADEAGSFTTLAGGLMVRADAATAVGVTSATLNGKVLGTGSAEHPEVYVCLDDSDQGTGGTSVWATVLHLGSAWGDGESFSTNLTGLLSGSNYAYRCYVTNSTGEAWFEYWPAAGGVTSTVAMGSQTGLFSTVATGLETSTGYEYRAVVSNLAGRVESGVEAFNTLGGMYVAQSGDNTTGGDWTAAYQDLQTAVDAAGAGAVIYVKAETFSRTSQVDLSGKVHLSIRGGYEGTGPEPGALAAGPSIFSRASGYTRLFYGNAATVTLERVRIQGGWLEANPSYGGGLHFTGGSQVTLLDCIVTGNRCNVLGTQEGGGLYINGGSLTVRDSTFSSNLLPKPGWQTVSRGGALAAVNAVVSISNTLFQSNYVHSRHNNAFGGAVYISGGQSEILDSTFALNYARGDVDNGSDNGQDYGGAIHLNAVNPFLIAGSLFTNNYCFGWGSTRRGDVLYVQGASAGAVVESVAILNGYNNSYGSDAQFYIAGGTVGMTNVLVAHGKRGNAVQVNNASASVTLDRCTLAANYLYGATRTAGELIVRNSIAWGNGSGGLNGPSTVDYSCLQEVHAGTGNLNTDPLFADTTHFHIQARAGVYTNGYFSGGTWVQSPVDSPCLDAGDSTAAYDNEPHPNGFQANMGAYGNSPTASKTYLEDPGVFTTLTAFAHPVVSLSPTSVRLRGQVLSAGGAEAPQAYLCWGTADGGTGGGTGSWQNAVDMGPRAEWDLFTHDVTELTEGWFYRAYVTNSTGSDWSSDVAFGAPSAAAVTNLGPYRVLRTTARLRGQVLSDDGNTPSIWFWHWPDGGAVTSVTAVGTFAAPLTFSTVQSNLTADTVYHYRILSSNSIGTSWSDTVTYSTLSTNPIARYVTVEGAGIFDGSSWSHAFVGMADALVACTYPGDTVYVKSGTYIRGQPLDLSGKPGLTISGGYTGEGEPGPLSVQPTVFTRDTDFNVRIIQGNAATATLERVTIRGGFLNANNSQGAGLRLTGGSHVTLISCVFTNNYMQAPGSACLGGAVYASASTLLASNCTFAASSVRKADYSTGSYGGAIYATGSAISLVDSLFANNYVWTRHQNCYGGAVYLTGGSLDVRGCTFTGHYTQQEGNLDGPGPARGGAIHANAPTAFSITDSFFQNNRCYTPNSAYSLREGGAVYVIGATGTKLITRSVFKGNGDGADENGDIYLASGTMGITNVLVAGSAGGSGIFNSAGTMEIDNCTLADNVLYGIRNVSGTVNIRNSIAWGNTAGGVTNATAVTYTCSQEVLAGDGNLVDDPLFVDTTYYHLQSRAGNYINGYFSGGEWDTSAVNSPCLAVGDRASDDSLEPKPNGGRVNLGAYGNTAVASKIGFAGSIFMIR